MNHNYPNLNNIKIGDLVLFKPSIDKENLTLLQSNKSFDFDKKTPVLLILSIKLENNNTRKACCTWYNMQEGKFEEKWLRLTLLYKIPSSSELSQIKVNESVVIKTYAFYQQQNQLSEVSFCPPKMVVTYFGVTEKQDKNTSNKQSKIVSNKLIKCMWYNTVRKTFSEKVFPIEALQVIE